MMQESHVWWLKTTIIYISQNNRFLVYRIKLVWDQMRILCECEWIDEMNIQRAENSENMERDEDNEGMVANIGCNNDDDVDNAFSFDLWIR